MLKSTNFLNLHVKKKLKDKKNENKNFNEKV